MSATVPCLVAGEDVVPAGAGLPVIDPATETEVARVAEAGPALVADAVAHAAGAAAQWRTVPVEERAALLERVADLLLRDADLVAGLVTRQMGMPRTLARVTQAELPASVLRATAELARGFGWREPVPGAMLHRWGAGVVGAVTPWNMPVHQIVAKAAAAVAAGCSMVLKPSEQTPLDAVHLARLFLEAGAPPGLLDVVTGTGPVTGAALVSHPALARVSFTGSVRAGREVAARAGANLVRCALELGGKSPGIVLPEADLTRAVPALVRSGLVNSGQACNATTRLLVPAARFDDVVDLLRDAVGALRLGDPTDAATDLGPLVTRAHRESVRARLAGALADGAQVLAGSPTPVEGMGWFQAPVVLGGLGRDAAAVREEIFGPVLAVLPYEERADDAELLALAHDTDYGLSAEVWGEPEHAAAVAARLRVGQVKINGVRTRERPCVPFGGVGASGYGRELGTMGIEEMTEVTAVMA